MFKVAESKMSIAGHQNAEYSWLKEDQLVNT